MRSFRIISSRKSESALVGIHGRSALSVETDENRLEIQSAPAVVTLDFSDMQEICRGFKADVEMSRSSSDSVLQDRSLLESWSAGHDAGGIAPSGARSARQSGLQFNAFALSRAIRKKWRQRTIRSVLLRIDSIPEQVEGMLSQTASDLSMQVDGGVVLMQDRLREASRGEQVAETLETLEMLPRHFATSVEANLMDAAAVLRQTVSSVTAELGARDFEGEDIVQEIQVIPQKVREIADEAISRAVNASVEELHQQLDAALGFGPGSSAVREKELLQQKLLEQLPVVVEKKITATGEVAEDKIVDAVADLKSEFVPNHWIMDALLRAKSDGMPSDVTEAPEAPEVAEDAEDAAVVPDVPHEIGSRKLCIQTHLASQDDGDKMDEIEHSRADQTMRMDMNPGSFGHPEMCTRPCLFFAAGECQSRQNCDFCHLPHTRRPTHLDKRNRELLRSLSSDEQVATILPILFEKLKKHNPSSLQLLVELESLTSSGALEAMSTTSVGSQGSQKQLARGERSLKSALRAVTLRSLLTMLLRMLPRDHLKQRHVIEALIQSLREP
ncbi:unnamed protein product [Durusdinium trenchii]|uniref:C3H1-type domain-containing protein n=1 Tax=Durusdinium trenchii TaxID=1381693 RepID=A0ABP0J7H2_9DINO